MKDLQKHISWIIDAHQNHPKKPKNGLRYWDMKTPYSIHPIWCAMTLLSETKAPTAIRENGALALLYHDILEDTTKKLPSSLSSRIKQLVEKMTFYGGIQEEMELVWERGEEIVLLKLYDKISTLLDAVWMKPEELREYKKYTMKLRARVIKTYGKLNITEIARVIAQ